MKRNFFKKLLIGGLITSFCICCCFIKVNATQLDDYSPTNDTPTLPLKTWEDINEPNDLLGVTLLFNDIIYPVGLLYNAENSYLNLSYNFNFEEYELESRPILWGCGSDGIQIKQEIGRGTILRLEEEYYADYPLTMFCGTTEIFNLYDMNYEYNLTNRTWKNTWQYGPRLISFPLDQRDTESVQLELIVDGYNWDSKFANAWQALFAFLRRNTTIIYSSNMASDLLSLSEIKAYEEGYALGYNVGYNKGYQDGEVNSGNDNYRFTFLTGIFNGVSDLLAIEIFPNVQLGYFVFVPLALGITGMIFWFWRKD